MSESEQPIAIPASFPFEWPDSGLEAHFWTWDQVHQPHPVTPLTASFESTAMSEGSTRGFQALAMPMNFVNMAYIVGVFFGALCFRHTGSSAYYRLGEVRLAQTKR